MKTIWLAAFNIITLLAWALYFTHASLHGLQFDEQSLLMLAFAQGLAIFEILNAILRIAGANWLLTTMQVFSRFLVVALLFWIPNERLVELGQHSIITGFMLITIAWSITEIVRALYYLTELFKKSIPAITFSRYTFFIVLYPIGVLGEFMIMYAFWEWREFQFDIFNMALAAIALSYFVFFPKLYGHMWKQRKKKLP
ncbi:MAG: protein tyrosine phosphatase-like domain-containing protein [Flavobacteriales bacterium]|nr:protein tyrosine phosphatase-like domain-containing protein [Flavobacteriales bacterium]MCB9190410.1 protein tyrosine phosphatase-like domain-containing protein [Flavobacteriales bacterium]MCB9204659.1 protein tyrosine phosphatase-like domain-containing protein [Flavobacteriales bacterium]